MKLHIPSSILSGHTAPGIIAAFTAVFVALFCPQADGAVTIQADLFDLADSVPGQDTWRASYTISGDPFAQNHGFLILFDVLLYAQISAPLTPVPAGWDVETYPPDPGFVAPGGLDALAVVAGPSLGTPFMVEFTWLGAGSPGSQSFDLYDLSGNYQIIGSGQTVARIPGGGTSVPDGGNTFWLLGIGASGAALARKRLRRKSV